MKISNTPLFIKFFRDKEKELKYRIEQELVDERLNVMLRIGEIIFKDRKDLVL